MASIRGSLKIVETNRQIRDQISAAMKHELDEVLLKAARLANDRIRELLYAALMQQPEVAALNNGQLMKEFGLVDGLSRIKEAISMWVNQVVIRRERVRLTTQGFTGSFTLKYIVRDFSDVLGEDFAEFVTEKGATLEWLSWLLLKGDESIIIRDYFISKFPVPHRSRTNTHIMIKKKGSRWNVPREYAGNINNNMVTRAIKDIDEQIIRILEESIIRA